MGARALFAFRRGQAALDRATEEEFLGALLEADCQRWVVEFVKAHREDPHDPAPRKRSRKPKPKPWR